MNASTSLFTIRPAKPSPDQPGTWREQWHYIDLCVAMRRLGMNRQDADFLSRALSIPHAPKERSRAA